MHIQSGLPGVPLSYGDHVCAFYHGDDQRDEVMLPFLRAGIEAGDPCISIVDSVYPEDVRAKVDPSASETALSIFPPEDAYLVDGHFDIDRMMGFWHDRVGKAVTPEVRGARALGEMTWSLRGAPGSDQLIRYESMLNDFLPLYPQVILCLYDLDRFTGATVVGMLSTHPLVLLNGTVWKNPYYLPPDEYLAA